MEDVSDIDNVLKNDRIKEREHNHMIGLQTLSVRLVGEMVHYIITRRPTIVAPEKLSRTASAPAQSR